MPASAPRRAFFFFFFFFFFSVGLGLPRLSAVAAAPAPWFSLVCQVWGCYVESSSYSDTWLHKNGRLRTG